MSSHGYPEVCEESSSEAAFARASEWLSYCVKHDKACTPPNDWWPKRLIDVNLGNQEGHPFLVEPTAPVTYTCLSYCWGPDTDDVLRTNKDNIDQHFSAISINSMPKTIQDAVTVCRGMKIPYLWVDSLCIQQDNHHVWLEESSDMDRTYFNSHLTIAALEPASCKLGFLGRQTFSDKRPNFEEFKENSQRLVPAWSDSPCSLNGRGWCLQEELLPNRRLCFNGEEMKWECLCHRICECGHQAWPNAYEYELAFEFDFGQLGAFLKRPLLSEVPSRVGTTDIGTNTVPGRRLDWLMNTGQQHSYPSIMTRTRELWRQLVSRYSRRALSYRKDKLAALEGMTKITLKTIEWEDGSSDENLAGLWKKEIHFELAWHVEDSKVALLDSRNHVNGQEGYCAPSWSWASSNGPVKYSFSDRFYETKWYKSPNHLARCELMEAECITELTGSSTGPVSQARIRLKGSLAAVELGILETEEGSTDLFDKSGSRFPHIDGFPRSKQMKGKVLVRSQNLQPVPVAMDNPVSPDIRLDDQKRSCWLEGKCQKGCCVWDETKVRQTQFYCFRLFSWSNRNYPTMGTQTWFLLLKMSSKGVFRRIGVGKQEIGRGRRYSIFEEDWPTSGWLFENANEEIIDIE